VDNVAYKALDINKLKTKKYTIVSSEDALKDVIPIQWDDDVADGKKKILLIDKN